MEIKIDLAVRERMILPFLDRASTLAVPVAYSIEKENQCSGQNEATFRNFYELQHRLVFARASCFFFFVFFPCVGERKFFFSLSFLKIFFTFL